MEELKEKVKELATIRGTLNKIRKQLDIDTMEREAKLLESDVRVLALEEYAKTGNKEVLPGVTIGIYYKVNVNNRKACFDWCRENMPLALTIDERVLKNNVKGMDESMVPDCIELVNEPRARIARELEVPNEEGEHDESEGVPENEEDL